MTAIGFSRDPRRIGDLCFREAALRFSAENRVLETKEFAQETRLGMDNRAEYVEPRRL